MTTTVTPIRPKGATSPSFNRGLEGNRTQQQVRYQRALNKIAEQRAQGKKTVTVALADLEALLCIAAHTDLAVAS